MTEPDNSNTTPEADAELAALDNDAVEIGNLLASRAHPSFEAGFASRVMKRVEGVDASPTLGLLIWRHFAQLAPVTLALGVILMAVNLFGLKRDDQTSVESLLGLQPITFESMYDYQTIAGGQLGGNLP